MKLPLTAKLLVLDAPFPYVSSRDSISVSGDGVGPPQTLFVNVPAAWNVPVGVGTVTVGMVTGPVFVMFKRRRYVSPGFSTPLAGLQVVVVAGNG